MNLYLACFVFKTGTLCTLLSIHDFHFKGFEAKGIECYEKFQNFFVLSSSRRIRRSRCGYSRAHPGIC